jgi:hypothetical protein
MSNPFQVSVSLAGSPAQFERLRALQSAFAEVCNAIAPIVQSTRCWNRVALHHLAYRTMRERFPALGSQMICNAVYSVSRISRLVLQHADSPWNVNKRFDAPLPLLRFADSAPVYFDRHTLSVKGTTLSLFTLDGRVRFDLRLAPVEMARFHQEKLIEIVLLRTSGGFDLHFQFARPGADDEIKEMSSQGVLPEYLIVIPPEETRSTPPVDSVRPDLALDQRAAG